MSKNPWRGVKASDLKRAIKTVREAGLSIANVDIGPDGHILLAIGNPAAAKPNDGETTEKLESLI